MSINTYMPDSTKIIHNTSVDFITRYINEPVHLVQFDNSSPIIAVKLYSNGTPYVIPDEMDVNIRIRKPDRTVIYNRALGCDSTKTIVYFEATTQMCAVYGDLYPIVEIIDSAKVKVAASGYIYLQIDVNPVNETDIESSSEATAIKDYVDAAESWAVGGTGTREGEDTNNSKYWSSVSARYEADSQAHANDSAASASQSQSYADDSKTYKEASEAAKDLSESYANAADTSANLAALQATNAQNSAAAALVSESNALGSANTAALEASNASDSATLSESWAVGGTGTRTDEDINNAKYWAEQAQATSGVHIATVDIAGVVKPDGTTITVDPDGTIHSAAEVEGDNVTIVKNGDGKLEVPIDNRTIYVGGDGKLKAAGGGGGAANIEDITKIDYDKALKDGTLDRDKYYAIVDDTEEGGGGSDGKGIIPITKAEYEELTREAPDLKKGKTYQIIDDMDDPELATESTFGFVKLSSDPGVSGNGLALPTSEKDENKSGTLANIIKAIKDKLGFSKTLDIGTDVVDGINKLNQNIVEKAKGKEFTTSNILANYQTYIKDNWLTLSQYQLVTTHFSNSNITMLICPFKNSGVYQQHGSVLILGREKNFKLKYGFNENGTWTWTDIL